MAFVVAAGFLKQMIENREALRSSLLLCQECFLQCLNWEKDGSEQLIMICKTLNLKGTKENQDLIANFFISDYSAWNNCYVTICNFLLPKNFSNMMIRFVIWQIRLLI
jgi:hypothetical protein